MNIFYTKNPTVNISRTHFVSLKTIGSEERDGRGVRALGAMKGPQYLSGQYKQKSDANSGRTIEGVRYRQAGWTPIIGRKKHLGTHPNEVRLHSYSSLFLTLG